MAKEELFNCSTNRVFSKIQKFWESYGDRFPLYFQKYFKANIFEMIDNNNLDGVDEVTKSIFNYLGLLGMEADKESQFLSFFEQYFGNNELYNKKIVSATQNFVPTVEKKIADEIFKGHHSGEIRTFGPNVVVSDTRVKPISKGFSAFELANDDDMILSFAPRENAEKILIAAINNQKELLLNFDGYVPERDAFFMPSNDGFFGELAYYANRHKNEAFDVDIVNYSPQGGTALVLKRNTF